MRYEAINSQLFINNRKRLLKEIKDHSLVVVNAKAEFSCGG